jgi:hypothetical protein
MSDAFQRLFSRPDSAVLSMNVQAALGPVRPPKRTQFSLLVRHFLERFFNHETASPDGDAKTRLVQIAFAASLPPFIVAIYLWPVYHPIAGWPPGQRNSGAPPSYWLQVNHHFFFVLYSFAAMGIATVFEWDLFFPDLLDLFVLGTLPIPQRRAFMARVGSIVILLAGFLLDINAFSTFVLPMAMDPPNLLRFLGGHLAAVASAGLFASAFILGTQGLLITIFGERIFRKLALVLQCLLITVFVILLLLFPVISGVVPEILGSHPHLALWFPPFWFLAIYQRAIEGPGALPIYRALAKIGISATLLASLLAILTYPFAYRRKEQQLIVGAGVGRFALPLLRPVRQFLHVTLVPNPVRRAVFHFMSQTILRVPRYRVHLVLYGGVGLSVVTASVLRFTASHGQILVEASSDGIRAALGIVVFWILAGLRMALFSSGNQRGRWVFRVLHGNPPSIETAVEQFVATRTWVLLVSTTAAFTACFILRAIAPAELATWRATGAQALLTLGLCVILTDAFFLKISSVPFTSEQSGENPNLALTVLKYFTFFPIVAAVPVRLEPWLESAVPHAAIFILAVVAAHALLERHHRAVLLEHCQQLPLDEDEEDFPMRLGLRY